MKTRFQPGDALVVVDVQNDFTPGGALPVPNGDRVIPVLNEWIAAAEAAGVPVIFTRDWHPADHISFKERGGPWPPHCIQHTHGAEFHPDLALPKTYIVHSKAMNPDQEEYSDLGGSEFAGWLRSIGIKRLWLGGLALDYCVHANTIHAIQEGFEAHMILPASLPITQETGEKALAEMREAGAHIDEDPRPYLQER